MINAKGELVGLIFDGNIQSLPGYFVYDAAVNRAVSVDARGMLEALKQRLQGELRSPTSSLGAQPRTRPRRPATSSRQADRLLPEIQHAASRSRRR